MKKIVLGFIIIIVSFTILIFYYGLKTKKVYDTEGLVGKPILKIDFELLNSEKIFNTEELRKNDFTSEVKK